MPTVHFGSGRKDTGRTDKYSEGTPLEAYKKYREDNPHDKTARKEMAEGKIKHHGRKTNEVARQELISLIQNSPHEFANSVEQGQYKEATYKWLEAFYKSIPVS